MSVRVTDDVGAVAGRLVAEGLGAAVADRGRAVLVLSGGTSPDPVLDWLAENLAPAVAAATVVSWTDERVVPYAGDWTTWPVELNRRAAWARWFSRVDRPPVEIVPWSGSGSPEDAVAAWAVPAIDVLLLGMGPDGHVASLFPGHPAADAVGEAVVVRDAPKPPPTRISLTLPKLQEARRAVLLVTGIEKGARYREAQAGRASTPIGRYVPAGRWDVVADAAAGLEGA
ncbi:MAG: 6-phosphogluconolactonase [Alphaproteobacteria bacterium]|nr:6-phosphogluconolactonase [Alphaproteobacteria bacterium]